MLQSDTIPAFQNHLSPASYRLWLLLAPAGVLVGLLIAFGGYVYGIAITVLILLVRWPVQASLGALALSLPFDNVSAVGSETTGTALTHYIAAACGCVLLCVGLVNKRLALPSKAALWWTLLVFWAVVTTAWAIDPVALQARIPTALSLLLLYLVAASFRITRRELSFVLLMTIVGACLASLLVSTEFFRGSLFHQTARASLVIGQRETDPNQFVASLLLPVSLALGFIIQSRGRLRIAMLAAALLMALSLLLTMSRGGMLAALALLCAYFYRLKAKRHIVTITACLALLLLAMPSSFFERLSFADRGAGRVDIWIASLHLLPQHGIIGAGLNNFAAAYTSVAGSAPTFRGFDRGSHNIYLNVAVELGIVGLGIMLLAFRDQLRELRLNALLPYEAACWGMLVLGFTLDITWRKSFWFCWILSAMAARRHRLDDSADERQHVF